MGQVRFVPKVNMAWLHPCIDGVAEAGMGEAQEDMIGLAVAVGSCRIIRNINLVSSCGSWHTAPKTL